MDSNNNDFSVKSKVLNESLFEVKDLNGISRKELYDWRKSGVLEDKRDSEATNKWVYFSPLDVVWIGIVSEMKKFKFSHVEMIACKEALFKDIKAEDGKLHPALEYYLHQILTFDLPIFLIYSYNDDGLESIWMMDDKDYFSKLTSGKIENHTSFLINKIIEKHLNPIYTLPNFDNLASLTNEEIKVLQIIRNGSYRHIKINKRDDSITTVEGIQRIEDVGYIEQLLKDGNYKSIEIKRQNGKIVSAYRTIRTNFK